MNEIYQHNRAVKRNRTVLMIVVLVIMSGTLSWFGRGYLGLTQGQYIGMLIATIVFSSIWDALAKWRRGV